jgi:hypothetical protein
METEKQENQRNEPLAEALADLPLNEKQAQATQGGLLPRPTETYTLNFEKIRL